MPGNVDLEADWLEIAPPGDGVVGGQQLHILPVADFGPSEHEEEFGRHFALFYPGTDFAALKKRLVEHGGQLIDAIRETPFERFFFRDPNGYMFEVIDQDGYVTE